MGNWLGNLIHDGRFCARTLAKKPGFTAIATLTFALCIAANAVIFAVVDAIILRPLPFTGSERLAIVTKDYPGAGMEHGGCSLTNYYDWRKGGIAAFASVSAMRDDSVVIGGDNSPLRATCARVTADFLDTLGVKPALGRFFTEQEIDDVKSKGVVLTDAYWRGHYNADPGVIGRAIKVDGQPGAIIGVLPRDFRYLSSHAQLYFPLTSKAQDRTPQQRHNGNTQVIARLAPGATLAGAQAQIRALDAKQLSDDPYAKQITAAGFHSSVSSLHADHVRAVRPTLLLLQGGALLLFLIGGVNLVNLMLVRASGRAKEFAMRQALGATRRHMAREILIETTLLAGIGGALGLVAGSFGVNMLSIFGASQLPLGAEVALHGRVAIVTLFGSLMAGCVLAVPVIAFNLHDRLAPALQAESRGGTAGHAAQRLRHGFIVAQIALAFALLTGSGLLGVSLRRVLAEPTGFHPDHVLIGQIGLPGARYRTDKTRLAFVERLLGELRAQPGVTFAAVSTMTPFASTSNINQSVVSVEGLAPLPGDSIRAHRFYTVAGDACQALGVPLRKGRLLSDADNQGKQRPCVVDEAFARRYWPNGDAIGHRIARDADFKADEAYTIVGVVGQAKQNDLAEESGYGAVYLAYRLGDAADQFYVIVRSSMTIDALAPALQKTVQHIDPELPVDDVRAMQDRIDASLAPRRSSAMLAIVFALVALLLTAIGVYGVLAYAVAQRRREIGVRMALGALPGQVLAHFLRLGARLLAVGIALGAFGAWAVGRAMASLLFGVGALDQGVLAATAGVMAVVVLLAVFIPARRAAKVDPMTALRAE